LLPIRCGGILVRKALGGKATRLICLEQDYKGGEFTGSALGGQKVIWAENPRSLNLGAERGSQASSEGLEEKRKCQGRSVASGTVKNHRMERGVVFGRLLAVAVS